MNARPRRGPYWNEELLMQHLGDADAIVIAVADSETMKINESLER
jgi:hypothetical protein